MGGICPCWKKFNQQKKKEFPYDVHQQTFQMDQHLGDLETIPKSEQQRDSINDQLESEIQIVKKKQNQNDQQQKNNKLIEYQKGNNDDNDSVQQEKKFIQAKNKEDQGYEKMVDEDISDHTPSQSDRNHDNLIIESNTKQQQILKNKSQIQKIEISEKQLKPLKKKYNPDDYRFINQQNTYRIKKIDSIKQQQFNIQNCKNCKYFIFDITANVYIDDTQNCLIYIAPCSSTIFIRNCKNLKIISACKQFRTFQTHNSQFSLYCNSQPVIENSTSLKFTSYQSILYLQLIEQFNKCHLNIWNNHWSEIYNFTKNYNQGKGFYQLVSNLEFINQIDWKQTLDEANLQIIEQDKYNVVPFVRGQYKPKESINQQKLKAIIIFKPSIDSTLISLKKIVPFDKIQILKSNYNKIANKGKEFYLSLYIQYNQEQLLDPLYQYGQILTEKEDIDQYLGKYFMGFHDER